MANYIKNPQGLPTAQVAIYEAPLHAVLAALQEERLSGRITDEQLLAISRRADELLAALVNGKGLLLNLKEGRYEVEELTAANTPVALGEEPFADDLVIGD